MSEHNNDPCDDIRRPEPNNPGDPETPEVEGFDFSPPVFPEVETLFEGVPLARECLIIPRNFFYNHQALFTMPAGRPRNIQDVTSETLTIQNPSTGGAPFAYDNFRFITGKVYDFNSYNNNNFIFNPENDANQERRLHFNIGYPIAIPIPPPGAEGRPGANNNYMEYFNITCDSQHAINRFSLSEPLADHRAARENRDILEFYKEIFRFANDREPDGTVVRYAPTSFIIDNAFKAPAAFFMKEADGLNIRLPELVSMQSFIPGRIAFSDNDTNYQEIYGLNVEDPLTRKSVYEKYSMEFDERPEHCPINDSYVTTHKFPASKVQLINDITNYAIPPEGSQAFSSFQGIFNSEYKFYTRISFDTNHESPIAAKLKEVNLDHLFLGILDTESPSKEEVYAQILDERLESFEGLADNDGLSLNNRPNSYYDFFSCFKKYLDYDHEQSVRETHLKVALDPATFPLSFEGEEGWITEDFENTFEGFNPIHYTLRHFTASTVFRDWLERYLTDKTRKFSKLLEGELSYSEVIAYRLEKRKKETGEVLQNFYFFNDPDTNRIDFIDTQVNFSEKYTYSIYVVNFVQGLSYRYHPLWENIINNISRTNGTFPSDIEPGGLRLEFAVEQRGVPYIIETPYHQQDLYVNDAPPLPPDVTFLPWETLSENLAFFWFTPRLGEIYTKPVPILEGDLEIIEQMRLAQSAQIYGNEELLFRSDTDPTHYEMFVLDEPPLSISDFMNARHTITTIEAPTMLKRVEPNRNYYLMFRAKDLAGISPPTRVFRFMISSYGDGIQHEIEEYDFPTEAQDYLLQFDQMIEIAPSRAQTTVNFEDSESYSSLLDDIPELAKTTRGTTGLSLGTQEDSVWDKTFIIEITSAQTGKVIKLEVTWEQIVEGALDQSQASEDSLSYEFHLANSCYDEERANIYRQNTLSSNESVGRRINRNIDESSSPRPSRAGAPSVDPSPAAVAQRRADRDAAERESDSIEPAIRGGGNNSGGY